MPATKEAPMPPGAQDPQADNLARAGLRVDAVPPIENFEAPDDARQTTDQLGSPATGAIIDVESVEVADKPAKPEAPARRGPKIPIGGPVAPSDKFSAYAQMVEQSRPQEEVIGQKHAPRDN